MDQKAKLVIKEATRKRCPIFKLDQNNFKKFTPISLELYDYFYQVDKINFSLFIKIEDEMVEFIQPKEISRELLDLMWKAAIKENSDIDVYILKHNKMDFENIIKSIRSKKIDHLIKENKSLDKKSLETFSELSSASQLIIKGGINQDVADRATNSVQFMMDKIISSEVAVSSLSRMILIDPTLYDHSASVAMLSGIISRFYIEKPLSPKEASIVSMCGLFHDTGKQCIPNSVLNKPGAFTPEEYEIMKTHTVSGYDELLRVMSEGVKMEKIIPRVALEHHERFEGHGYPMKKKGREEEDPKNGIHLYTRIVSIADAYSALLMERVYKPALSQEEAIRLMSQNAAKDFDLKIYLPFVKGVIKSLKVENPNYDGSKLINQILNKNTQEENEMTKNTIDNKDNTIVYSKKKIKIKQ